MISFKIKTSWSYEVYTQFCGKYQPSLFISFKKKYFILNIGNKKDKTRANFWGLRFVGRVKDWTVKLHGSVEKPFFLDFSFRFTSFFLNFERRKNLLDLLIFSLIHPFRRNSNFLHGFSWKENIKMGKINEEKPATSCIIIVTL